LDNTLETGATPINLAFQAAAPSSFALRITRQATGLQVNLYKDSSIVLSFVDTTAGIGGANETTLGLGTYDQMYITAINNTTYALDNVTITNSIPEPAAFASLSGAALLAWAASRRRRA
jgi:hypothetical protein